MQNLHTGEKLNIRSSRMDKGGEKVKLKNAKFAQRRKAD